jgi:hypothetical protein
MSQKQSGHRILEVSEAGIDARTVGAFIEAHWQKRVALSTPRFFEWQFGESPRSGGRNRCLVLLDGKDAIQGFMGVTPREFVLDGKRLGGAELTTWILSETVRGLGLGKAIVQKLQASYGAIIGMGISESALPIYATHGFKYMRHLPRYVRVFDPERVAPISKLEPLGERLIRAEPAPIDVRFEATAIGFPEAAELAEPLHQTLNCTIRDSAYLRWRYAEHPVYRYEVFRVAHDAGQAGVVLRQDDVGDLRVLHVVDFLGAGADVPAVLAFLEELGRERGVALADFYCSADPIGHQFWSHGWFSSVDDFYSQVPNWFYPIDMRIPPTTSLILWARDDVGALLDRSRVYITKGDCDMDRPTTNYFESKGIEL